MLYSTITITAAAFAGFASAQMATNYTTSGPLNITASQIDLVERQAWCRGEMNNCPLICNGDAYPNTCDSDSLAFNCTCTDGSKPNITDYAEMMPAYICAQWVKNCVASHPNDLPGITACRSVVCGMKNASAIASNSSSGSSGSSGAGSSAAASSGAAASGGAATTTTAVTTSTTGTSGGAGAATTTTATTTSTHGGAAIVKHAENFGSTVLALLLLGMFGWAM